MAKTFKIESPIVEHAVLVGVRLPRHFEWEVDYSLDELEQLVRTAGAKVIARVIQSKEAPHPKTFIGTGKAAEIKSLLADAENGMAVFDDELSPSQLLNLEKIIDRKIIDRTGLILDIFAQHAYSAEGKVQVELAQLNYYMTRLKGLGIEMSRLGGGIGTRGPGETKLETDRRRLRRRVQQLTAELKNLGNIRRTQRSRRLATGAFGVSLVGYTNAGKSSLLNRLTDAGVLVEDKLFATLDSTSRQLKLPGGKMVIISDTVGFINKLPHELVAAFKSTLQEVKEAHLIIHVIDASNAHVEKQMAAVEVILKELDVGTTPRLMVYNKDDLIGDAEKATLNCKPEAVAISALTGEGIELLLEKVELVMAGEYELASLLIPYEDGAVRQSIYELGVVVEERAEEAGMFITAELKPAEAKKYEKYKVKDSK